MGIGGGEQVFEPNETPRKIVVPNLMPADKNYGAAIHIFTVGTCGFCRSFKKQNPEFLASDQGLVHTRITQDGELIAWAKTKEAPVSHRSNPTDPDSTQMGESSILSLRCFGTSLKGGATFTANAKARVLRARRRR